MWWIGAACIVFIIILCFTGAIKAFKDISNVDETEMRKVDITNWREIHEHKLSINEKVDFYYSVFSAPILSTYSMLSIYCLVITSSMYFSQWCRCNWKRKSTKTVYTNTTSK